MRNSKRRSRMAKATMDSNSANWSPAQHRTQMKNGTSQIARAQRCLLIGGQSEALLHIESGRKRMQRFWLKQGWCQFPPMHCSPELILLVSE